MIEPGSKVGVITPSCNLNSPEEIRTGLRYLQELGYQVVLGKYVFDKHNNMGGTPEQRAEDIMTFFKDPDIKAIFCTRGGYGAQYILPELDYDIIKKNPKPIIGFSDITALHMGIYAETGTSGYAGILLKYDFEKGDLNPRTARSLKNVLAGEKEAFNTGNTVNPGKASGILLGTNLCVLMLLAGTPYFPPLDNAILLLEDVDDASFRFERMLLQLRQQKDFHKVKGIIFGAFTDCTIKHPDDKDMNEIIDEFATGTSIPIIKNFPFGHITARPVLPLGAKVELDADNCVLKFI